MVALFRATASDGAAEGKRKKAADPRGSAEEGNVESWGVRRQQAGGVSPTSSRGGVAASASS